MNGRRMTAPPAAMAAILLVAGCSSVASSPTATTPRPSPTVAATATPTRLGAIPSPIVTDPGGVAAAIGGIVVPGGDRLLPAYIPPGMSATVRTHQQSYTVIYTDDLHTRQITLSVNVGANPPPQTGPNPSSNSIQFRGVRTVYVVYDATAPLSQRYLLWPEEKGAAAPDYFLGATGLTEAEFFRIANSLRAF